MDLTKKKCVACEPARPGGGGGMPPLNKAEADVLLKEVPGWNLSTDTKKISREFTFPDFKSALAFVDQVGAIAEAEGHHPDIALTYGRVGIELSTHAVKGLSENDFILAAKVNEARGE